jgi:uncharacterized membrane protein
MEVSHAWIELTARMLEYAGIAAILLGAVYALARFAFEVGTRRGGAIECYEALRANLGRGVLFGLELLVGADIIATITAPLTLESVALLAAIVAIRTFLSYSVSAEIEGGFRRSAT